MVTYVGVLKEGFTPTQALSSLVLMVYWRAQKAGRKKNRGCTQVRHMYRQKRPVLGRKAHNTYVVSVVNVPMGILNFELDSLASSDVHLPVDGGGVGMIISTKHQTSGKKQRCVS